MPAATTANSVTMTAIVMPNREKLERPCSASEASLDAVAVAAEALSLRVKEAWSLADETDAATEEAAVEAVSEAADTAEDTDPETEEAAVEAVSEAADAADDTDPETE